MSGPELREEIPTEHMSVHVEHRLPGMRVSVEHHPVPVVRDPLGLGDLRGLDQYSRRQFRGLGRSSAAFR